MISCFFVHRRGGKVQLLNSQTQSTNSRFKPMYPPKVSGPTMFVTFVDCVRPYGQCLAVLYYYEIYASKIY